MKRDARVIGAALLALALAVLAAYVARDGGSIANDAAASAANAKSSERSDDFAGPSTAAASGASNETARRAPSPREQAADAPGSDSVRFVRIVEATTGNAVDGARIAYFQFEPGADSAAHVAWDLESCDSWLAERGSVTASGRDGLAVLLARPDRDCIVVASHKGLYGRRTLPAHDPSTLAVALVLDFTLEVKVLGADGAPVSRAPVVLRTPERSRFVEHAERVTDANGSARFAHVALRAPESGSALNVAVKGLLGEDAEATLDLLDPPRSPVVLRLPAFGGLDVRVVGIDTDSRALPERVEVRYDDQPDDLETRWRNGPSVAAPLEKGLARFRHLRVGAAFVVSSKIENSHRESRVRTRGPRFQGEVVPVELRLAVEGTLLRVRLVDSAGQPLAERAVATRVDSRFDGHTWEATAHGRSDAAGGVDVWIAPLARNDGERSLTVTERAPDGSPLRSGTLALLPTLPSGGLEGGDLTLTELPVLVGGRVVDSDGAPVAGARVLAAVEAPDGEPREFETLDISSTTDALGAFTLRDSSPTATVRVSALHGERRSNTLECPRGATDVELELRTGGAIAGRVLVDADVPVDALIPVVHPSELTDPQIDAPSRSAKLDPDGRFRVGGLYPGRYRFQLAGWSAGRPLDGIDDVVVRAGETNEDPRLATLDLRGRISALRVVLLPPKPGAAVRGQLSLRASGSGNSGDTPYWNAIEAPIFTLLAPWPESDVTLDVLGYRRVELRAVRGEQRVKLLPAPLLRLRLPADVELPSPPSYLKVHLTPSGYQSITAPQQLETAFGPSREVEFRSPHLGELEVHWFVETRSPTFLVNWRLSEPAPQRIQVLDIASDQIFELAVPVEQIAPHLKR